MNNLAKNSLEPPFTAGQCWQKRKQKGPVTIAIGLICNNAIVMASDSQTADMETGKTRRDVDKITKLEFKDGQTGLVAQSGHEVMSARAAEILTAIAKSELLNDYRKGAELAEKAIADLRRQFRAQYEGSEEGFKRHCLDYSFELLVGYYYGGKPHLFTLQFYLGIAKKVLAAYESIGIGAPLGNYILSRCDVADLQLGAAVAAALYVVEDVKKTDFRCQGPTKAAYTIPVGSKDFPEMKMQTVLMSREEVEERVQKLNKFDDEFKAEWKRRLTNMVYGVAHSSPVQPPEQMGCSAAIVSGTVYDQKQGK
ncbi:MAG: hypothetical protein ABSH15_00785 [Verrucomicrobiota bacterium]|jgi:20S proteasome alpha/beta subunit